MKHRREGGLSSKLANYRIRNLLRFLPDAMSMANHLGILPRPDHVSEGFSGFLNCGATVR
jgi:hypothetical protein